MRSRLWAGLFTLLMWVPCAQAQAPLHIVVPFPPGGVTDLAARALAEKMQPAMGQTLIVENRPGGGSRIGTEAVQKAPPDGKTVLFTNTSYAIAPIADPSVKYEPDKSLAPVGIAASYGLAIAVSKAVPASTLQEFIAYARANPGKLSYGSSGMGSGAHFAGEQFKAMTGTSLVHIPYKSTVAALNDVAAGLIELAFDATAKTYADAGKVKILAVTSEQRDPRMPAVPTAVEAGLKGYVQQAWAGFLAPVGTPPAMLKRWNEALNKALSDSSLQARLRDLGLTPEGGTPARMLRQIQQDEAMYRRIAVDTRMRLGE